MLTVGKRTRIPGDVNRPGPCGDLGLIERWLETATERQNPDGTGRVEWQFPTYHRTRPTKLVVFS